MQKTVERATAQSRGEANTLVKEVLAEFHLGSIDMTTKNLVAAWSIEIKPVPEKIIGTVASALIVHGIINYHQGDTITCSISRI